MDSTLQVTRIGKFEMRQIINDFDSTLIQLYDVNMRDASISRYEAIEAYNEFHCARKAAEAVGTRLGLKRKSA